MTFIKLEDVKGLVFITGLCYIVTTEYLKNRRL